jgi:capsule polysaccharide export protein KpsE/RkpR
MKKDEYKSAIEAFEKALKDARSRKIPLGLSIIPKKPDSTGTE